jgi:hypothetical protein
MSLHPEHDLLQAYLDSALSAAEESALESRFANDSGLADALLLLTREEATFREWSAATRAAEQISPAERAEPASRAAPRRRPQLTRLVALATVAASLSAIAIYLVQPGTTPEAQVIATVEDVHGAVTVVGGDGIAKVAMAGQSIFADQEVQTGEDESSTVVRVQDCRLVLAAETRIRLGKETVSDSPLVYVSEGIVEAEMSAKPRNRPVLIRSALAEITGSVGKFNFASLPDSTFIGTDDGSARLTRKSDGRSIEVPRGKYAVVESNNKPLQYQTSASRASAPVRTLLVGAPLSSLFFEPEGLSLLTCTSVSIKRWETSTGKLVATVFSHPKKGVRQFTAGLDGRLLGISDNELSARLIDSVSGLERTNYHTSKRLMAMALAADSRTLAISWAALKEGNEVRLYDTTLGLERTLHTGHAGPILALAFSGRGNYLASLGGDRSVRIWDANDLRSVRNLLKLPHDVRCLAFSPDERLLALGERKGSIRIFDVASGTEQRVLTGHLREVTAIGFAPDGVTLASASADGTARLWNTANGIELTTFKGHAGSVNSVAYSQDGRTLATGGVDRKVLFWELTAIR